MNCNNEKQICRKIIASKVTRPEITKITNPTTENHEDTNILVQAGKFIEGLSKAGIAVKIRNAANAKATDNILTSMGTAGEVTDTSSEVSSDSGDSSSEQDTGDDMGMTDLEMPTGEEPAEADGDTQEPPAEEAAPPAGL